MSFKRVLIAVDESTFAAHAADVGIELARSLRAEMGFVSVVDPSIYRASSDAGVPADKLIATAEREAKDLLVAFRERAEASPPALEFLEMGKPTTKIVEAAKNWCADLIVIGTHGLGVVQSILLGSVAQGVLRHAPCPVVVVQARS